MPLSIDSRKNKKEEFFHELLELYHVLTYENNDIEKVNSKFERVLVLLSHFPSDMLPYSVASEFIYEKDDEGMEYFFQYFEELLMDRFKGLEDLELFKKAVRLLEHMDLAVAQKSYLFRRQEYKIAEFDKELCSIEGALSKFEVTTKQIRNNLVEFENIKKSYYKLEQDIDELGEKLHSFESTYTQFSDEFDKIKKNTDRLTVNLISILGIFASILLGAYGSIQGFSNIFANADKISIGKILMLSSVGASAILLILFFLLSSIARLTEKSFGNGGTTFISKHPIMFFGHCILLIIFTTGGVIEIIKGEITLEKNWLWIILIVILVIQVLFIYYTKSMWGILKYLHQNSKEAFKKTMRYITFVIMLIIIGAYYFGYF